MASGSKPARAEPFNANPGRLTDGFLSAQLGRAVTLTSIEPLTDGHMAQVLRLRFSAVGAGTDHAREETVIFKGAGPSKTQDVAARFNSHAREAEFYRTLAPKLDVATPKCWSVAAPFAAEPWLLLEDLSPKAALAPPLTVLSALTVLARLHRETQSNALTRITFTNNIKDLTGFIQVQDQARVEQLVTGSLQPSAPLASRMLSGLDTIEARLHHPGPALIHCDFRWDNLSAAHSGCLFDWGDYCAGPPAYDLGYFFVTSTQGLDPSGSRLSAWLEHYLNAMNERAQAARPALTRAGLIEDLQQLLPIIAWTPAMMLLTAAELPGAQHTYWRAALAHCETLSAQLRGL